MLLPLASHLKQSVGDAYFAVGILASAPWVLDLEDMALGQRKTEHIETHGMEQTLKSSRSEIVTLASNT